MVKCAEPKQKTKPGVPMEIHKNWENLILYCGMAFQNGSLCFETEAAIPMELLSPGTEERILFGKTSPKPLFIRDKNAPNVTIVVTRKWEGLILWCRKSFPYGQVCIQMAAGEPKEPIGEYTKAKIRFDHPETFPEIVRFFPVRD